MDRTNKAMKRENELLEAIKASNTCVVQRILTKCQSRKSKTCDKSNSIFPFGILPDIIASKLINLNIQDKNG